MLLVLDNCEHVVDAAAEFAQAIAEGCPDVRVLATSREGLGLRHGLERLIPVAPLEPSGPGADLFCERASAASPAFDALTSRRSVEEICRRLDGVPLAIELAAARTASRTPADLLSRSTTISVSWWRGGGPAVSVTGRCGPPSSGPTTCSPRRSGCSFSGCRSSSGHSTSPPPRWSRPTLHVQESSPDLTKPSPYLTGHSGV